MTDEVEQKPEATKIRRPSDAAAEAGVISGQTNQVEHDKAFKLAHAADRTPSGIMPALHESFGISGDLTAEDLGIKPSQKQALPDTAVAWDPKEQLNNWGDDLKRTARQAKQAASEVSADLTKDGAILDKPGHPYKNNPDQLMDYNACAKAWNHFPALKRHSNLDSALLPAIIRNEVRSLRPDDQLLWNPSAEHGLGFERNRTIGPANMSTSNIDRLIHKYPQLTDPELGGIDPKHPYRDAVNPAKAAWLCAAYLADAAENLEASGHKTVSHRDLIKSYNPNADQDAQFKRIHEQIIQIKQHHPLFRAD